MRRNYQLMAESIQWKQTTAKYKVKEKKRADSLRTNKRYTFK